MLKQIHACCLALVLLAPLSAEAHHGKRAVVVSASPAVSYYAPAVSYYAPAPAVSYYAPAPAVSYYAPAVSYYAPAPVVSYYAPAPVVYSSPSTVTSYRYGLFGRRGYDVYSPGTTYVAPSAVVPVRSFYYSPAYIYP